MNIPRRAAIQLLAAMPFQPQVLTKDLLFVDKSFSFVLEDDIPIRVRYKGEEIRITAREIFDALQPQAQGTPGLVDGHCPICGIKGQRPADASSTSLNLWACENCGNVFWSPQAQ